MFKMLFVVKAKTPIIEAGEVLNALFTFAALMTIINHNQNKSIKKEK